MTTIGIICEYNPFHNGHAKQLRLLRERFGENCRIVCLMSGSYVQRGEPAIFDKQLRAEIATACGADVVLELPITYVLSSAEGFAAGGVKLLSALGVNYLCFGSETGDAALLMQTAQALLDPQMDAMIKDALQTGISYAAARQNALSTLFPDGAAVIQRPNDILAVEYCKAILSRQSPMEIYPIVRQGDYHAPLPELDNPSASAVRSVLLQGEDASAYLPQAAAYVGAARHSIAAGERAILARLKGLTEEEFSTVPYGGEGLWRRLMHACRDNCDYESIVAQTKSKRYARTRIQRMILCAFLGVTTKDFAVIPDYVRILSFSEQGRALLREMKDSEVTLVPAAKKVRGSAYAALESRCEQMYFLFEEIKQRQ